MLPLLPLLAALLLQAPPAAGAPPTGQFPWSGERGLAAASPVVAQLLAEAESVSYHVDGRGWATVYLTTHRRASSQGGICERESVRIEMERPDAAAGGGPGERPRIRGLELKRYFRVVADARGEPLWELRNDALEAACVARPAPLDPWFEAASVFEVWPAVVGLAQVKSALADPHSPLIRWRCWDGSHLPQVRGTRLVPRRPTCIERERMAALIAPTNPGGILQVSASAACSNGGQSRCQTFFLYDPGGRSMTLEMETDPILPFGLRSATFIQRPVTYYGP
jgi:hypothetical protein